MKLFLAVIAASGTAALAFSPPAAAARDRSATALRANNNNNNSVGNYYSDRTANAISVIADAAVRLEIADIVGDAPDRGEAADLDELDYWDKCFDLLAGSN